MTPAAPQPAPATPAPRNAGTPLAQDFLTLYQSPDPARYYCYTPGLATCPSGRLIATYEINGPDLPEPRLARGDGGRATQGQICTSDDHGKTWQLRGRFPFMHARPFVAGSSLYVLGQARDLMIIRSDDWGNTWSAPVKLTDGQAWHQSACNVHYAHGCAYLAMERRVSFDLKTWEVGELAPVLMRGRVDADLTRAENWTFASELSFRSLIPNVETDPAIDFFGVPFYAAPYPYGSMPAAGRECAPLGWLETNVVQIADPAHYWFDPRGCTYHLWMRAHTGGTGYAALAKVIEDAPGQGKLTTTLETVPSGKRALFVPCPGGHMRFHVLFDETTRLYWLLSTQATDSMTRVELLPKERYNLPSNERRRLQLHFSRNMIDWCFAGIVAIGDADNAARHYASMTIDGNTLHILSRSGTPAAASAHNGNLITLHTLRDFRHLAY